MYKNKLFIGGIGVFVGGLLLLSIFSSNQVSSNNTTNNPAPDFTLQKLNGGMVSLSEFKGQKPVVVDFWASWCPNCRRDMPKLNGFYEKYKDKIEVIGVNLQETEATVRDFITSRGISFPIAFDPSGRVANTFGVQYTNTHVLIDVNGNLVRTIPGDIREADIVSLIEQSIDSEAQSYIPDQKPCKIALAEHSEQTGLCSNESI